MLSFWLPAAIAISGSQAGLPTRIELRGSEFVLRAGSRIERVPLRAPVEPDGTSEWPPKRLLFRRDAAYAVWDSRGLSVRQGDWVFTTKLVEIPTTPKLFSRDEILHTNDLIQKGIRSKEVAALSGALRDGKFVYFLARWEEKGGRPWMEALLQVDLTEGKPKPKLLGKFEGLSLGLREGQSRLFIRDAKPAAWVKSDREWGLGIFNPNYGDFEFKKVGGQVDRVELLDDRIGYFIERTDHPSRILSRWDKVTLARRELVETRGTIRLLDKVEPWMAVIHEDEGSFLQNLESGARLQLLESPEIRRTPLGFLLWSPAARPEKAALYHPERWEAVGVWERPQGRPFGHR